MGHKTGMLILKRVPEQNIEATALFLSRYVQGNGKNYQEIEKLLRKTPLILKREIEEEAAQEVGEKLSAFQAEVLFIPTHERDPSDQKTPETEKETPSKEEPSCQCQIEEKGSSKEHFEDFEEDPILREIFQEEEKKPTKPICYRLKERIKEELYQVNREIWLILSMVTMIPSIGNFFKVIGNSESASSASSLFQSASSPLSLILTSIATAVILPFQPIVSVLLYLHLKHKEDQVEDRQEILQHFR